MCLAPPTGELRAEISVQHEHIWFVDGDVIADWGQAVTIS